MLDNGPEQKPSFLWGSPGQGPGAAPGSWPGGFFCMGFCGWHRPWDLLGTGGGTVRAGQRPQLAVGGFVPVSPTLTPPRFGLRLEGADSWPVQGKKRPWLSFGHVRQGTGVTEVK